MPLINKCPGKSGIKINGRVESYPKGDNSFVKGDLVDVDVDFLSSPTVTTLRSNMNASPYSHDVKCIELTDGHIMAVYTTYKSSTSLTCLNVLEVDNNNNITLVAQATTIYGHQYTFEMVQLTNNRALIFYTDTRSSNGGIKALVASYSNGVISTVETNFSTESIRKATNNFKLIHLTGDKYLLLYTTDQIKAMKLQITSDGVISVLVSGTYVMEGHGIVAAERLSDKKVFIASGFYLGHTTTDASFTYWRTVVSVGDTNISALPQTDFSSYLYGITDYAGGVIAIDSNNLFLMPCRSYTNPIILTVSGEEIIETVVSQSFLFYGSNIGDLKPVFCITTHGSHRLLFYTGSSSLYIAHILLTATNEIIFVSKKTLPFTGTGSSQSNYGVCLTATGKVIVVFPTNGSPMQMNAGVAAEIKAVPNYYEHYGMVAADAVPENDLQITSIRKEGE